MRRSFPCILGRIIDRAQWDETGLRSGGRIGVSVRGDAVIGRLPGIAHEVERAPDRIAAVEPAVAAKLLKQAVLDGYGPFLRGLLGPEPGSQLGVDEAGSLPSATEMSALKVGGGAFFSPGYPKLRGFSDKLQAHTLISTSSAPSAVWSKPALRTARLGGHIGRGRVARVAWTESV